MYRESRDQKNPATGRLASVVSRRAAGNGSDTFFTQTFRVSFQGLRHATNLPSGESWQPAISGLPNRSSRSISGGSPVDVFCAKTGTRITRAARKKLFMAASFLSDHPLDTIHGSFAHCLRFLL